MRSKTYITIARGDGLMIKIKKECNPCVTLLFIICLID